MFHAQMFLLLSLARNMELGAGPSEAEVEKEKGKKPTKAPRGEKDKDQMKYKFQGEPLNSKVTTDWRETSHTNLGHIDIDEFKQRV